MIENVNVKFISADFLPQHKNLVLVRGYSKDKQNYEYEVGRLKRSLTGYIWIDKNGSELSFKPEEYAELHQKNDKNLNELLYNERMSLNKLRDVIDGLTGYDVITINHYKMLSPKNPETDSKNNTITIIYN